MGSAPGHEPRSRDEGLRPPRRAPQIRARGALTPLLWLLACTLPATALVARLPAHPLFLVVLHNAGHAPVFGAFAVVVLLLLRRRAGMQGWHGFVAAFVLAVAAGATVELLQPFVGRGAEFDDLLMDSLGAAGGLGFAAFFMRGPGRVAGLIVGIAAFAIALGPLTRSTLAYVERARQMPTLLDFSSGLDWYFLRFRGLRVDAATAGECGAGDVPPGLRVRIAGGRFPGLTHLEPEPDWTRYRRLRLDLTNPESVPLPLTIRIHDSHHNKQMDDRFNRNLELAPSARTITTIALDEIAAAPRSRTLDLAHVAGLILFAGDEPGLVGRSFCINRVWLD